MIKLNSTPSPFSCACPPLAEREEEKGDELEYEVMNLNIENKLREIAKERCRELRKNQTSSEEILWKVIRNRSFLRKKFYRQYPLFFDYLGKETFYIADFYCHEEKLVIEIDGKIHEKQKRKVAHRCN